MAIKVTPAPGLETRNDDSVVGKRSQPLNFRTDGSVAIFEIENLVTGNRDVITAPDILKSDYNDNNRTGDCRVSDVTTYSRRVANPSGGLFDIGDWAANSLQTCLHTNAQSYTTPNPCFFLNNTSTTIEVNIYDADETTVLNTHTTAAITGNTDVTVDSIRIQVTNWANTTLIFYEGDITVTFNINDVIAGGGRYKVKVTHHNGADDNDKTQASLFSDTEDLTASLTGVTIAENAITGRFRSGVNHYTIGDTFQVDITDMDNLNSRSYPTTQVQIFGSEFALPTLSLAGASLTGWTNAHDDDNDTYQKVNWTISTANYFALTTTGNVSARYIDWSNGALQNSANASYAIHTYTATSTADNRWDLAFEDWRLKNDYSTAWDSTDDITTDDGGDGLQIGGAEAAFYPVTNYTNIYEPTKAAQPDYSGAAGIRYIRGEMFHTDTAHPNGIFQIGGGVTEANITADDWKVEISLDGTDWYNCNELYTGGVLADGDGCRTNAGTYNFTNATKQLQFTLGTGGTTGAGTGGDSGWGVLVRESMPATSTVVHTGYIEINDWS